jgi:hypothetical protein
MYLCDMGINFTPFYDFLINFGNGRLNQGLGDFTHKLNSLISLLKTGLRIAYIEYTLRLYLP